MKKFDKRALLDLNEDRKILFNKVCLFLTCTSSNPLLFPQLWRNKPIIVEVLSENRQYALNSQLISSEKANGLPYCSVVLLVKAVANRQPLFEHLHLFFEGETVNNQDTAQNYEFIWIVVVSWNSFPFPTFVF